MTKYISIFCLAITFLCTTFTYADISSNVGGYVIKTGAVSLILDKSASIKLSSGAYESESIPAIALYNGKSNDQAITLGSPVSSTLKNGILQYNYAANSGTLNVTLEFITSGNYVACKVAVSNDSGEQLWVKPALNLPLFFKGNSINYWDGTTLAEGFSGAAVNNRLFGQFPAVGVYDGEAGLSVGIPATQVSSYIEASLNYTGTKTLSYAVKMVVDSGKTESCEFIIFGFKPEYGYSNAVDLYYNKYPSCFKPADGIDLHALTTGEAQWAQSFEVAHTGESYEQFRRSYSGIIWWYAPFRKAGDWWGSEEEWKIPLKHEDKMEARFKVPLTEFQAERRKVVKSAALKGTYPLAYIIGWCEEDLAKRKYPNQIMVSHDGAMLLRDAWVQGFTSDQCMWWGGKFAEDTRADVAKLVKDLEITGVAFDCADGGARARESNDITGFPGRAYDEHGVYCEQGISIGRMMEYVHSLKRDNTRMATWANLNAPGSYLVATHADTVLIEPSLSDVLQDIPKFERMRYMLGSKPRQFYLFLGAETIGNTVDWKSMSAEQIRSYYRVLWDRALLVSFKLAMLPASDMVNGYSKMIKAMPVLTTLVTEGWQPVPAIKLNADLWTSRYGRDLKSYIFVGNQSDTKQALNAAVDNKYLGKGSYLFSKYDGGELKNDITNGQTHLDFILESKDYQVIKAQVRIATDSDISGLVKETSDFSGGATTATIAVSHSETTQVSIRIPGGVSVASVTVNTKPAAYRILNDQVVVRTKLGRNTQIKVQWKSKVFLAASGKLLNYQFVKEEKPNCTIIIDNNADEWDTAAANRLSEYFRYYYQEVKGKSVNIPVMKKSAAYSTKSNMIFIGKSAKPSGQGTISITGNRINVTAPDSRSRHTLVFQLMQVLDKKYPYNGTIYYGPDWVHKDEQTVKMREKAGIGNGGKLDWLEQ